MADFFAGEQAYSVNFGCMSLSNSKLSLVGGAAFSSGGDDAFRLGVQYYFGAKSRKGLAVNGLSNSSIKSELKQAKAEMRVLKQQQKRELAHMKGELDTLREQLSLLLVRDEQNQSGLSHGVIFKHGENKNNQYLKDKSL